MSSLARAARWERAAIVGSLGLATALAWACTVPMALSPSGCHSVGPWGSGDVAAAFGMWAVMMAGMMLPTAVPVTLALADAAGASREGPRAVSSAGGFVVGYLAVWTAYSALAALSQWGLREATLLSPSLALGPVAGGALLVAAGAFQWSPWKDACMAKCRSPLGFLLTHWRPGRLGALAMGARYGGYCVGCCWLLMALSFALGVMNLVWMVAVTAFMIAEKALPGGRTVTRVAGLLLTAWGVGLMSAAVVG